MSRGWSHVGVVVAVMLLLAVPSTAHHKWFTVAPRALTGLVMNCGPGEDFLLDQSFGGFCFGTKADGTLPDNYPDDSDCVPLFMNGLDLTGICSIWITDALTFVPLAHYCQDLNDDGLCGGSAVGPANARTEPNVGFCNSITINTPLDLTPRGPGVWNGGPQSDEATTWVTNNWDPDSTIYVFFTGVLGNFAALPDVDAIFRGESPVAESSSGSETASLTNCAPASHGFGYHS